jgi:hypothetical protein
MGGWLGLRNGWMVGFKEWVGLWRIYGGFMAQGGSMSL